MEEARGREHAVLERSRSINEARQAERKAERMLSSSDQEARRWQATLEQDKQEEQERAHRADRLRTERKQVGRTVTAAGQLGKVAAGCCCLKQVN